MHSNVARSDLTVRAERQTSKAKLIFSNAQLERISSRRSSEHFGDPWPKRNYEASGGEFFFYGETNFDEETSFCSNAHVPSHNFHSVSPYPTAPLALKVVSTCCCPGDCYLQGGDASCCCNYMFRDNYLSSCYSENICNEFFPTADSPDLLIGSAVSYRVLICCPQPLTQ